MDAHKESIDMKKVFVLKKRKVYLLFREEREDVHKFISEQLRKRYIKPLEIASNCTRVFCRKER